VSSSHYSDDVLRYGQKIRVLVNPAVLGLPVDSAGGPSPHYLFSKPMSTTHHSKYTHHQVCPLVIGACMHACRVSCSARPSRLHQVWPVSNTWGVRGLLVNHTTNMCCSRPTYCSLSNQHSTPGLGAFVVWCLHFLPIADGDLADCCTGWGTCPTNPIHYTQQIMYVLLSYHSYPG
jgi:hypothetical protein